MPITNFPQGVSSFGIPVVGGNGLPTTTGNYWFVYSGGTNPQDGTSPSTAFRTVSQAVTAATAANGDVVVIMPGHAETITTGTSFGSWSKAGLQFIGLGIGAARPTFTFTTGIGATVNVTAANNTVQNCLFVANFADVTACFTLTTAKNFVINGCEFRDTDATHNFVAVVKTSTTDAAADGLTFINSKQISAGLTANTAVFDLRANLDRLTIQGNTIQSLVAGNSGLIYQATTTKVLTTVTIDNNILNLTGANAATGALLITTATTMTGVVSNNYVWGARAVASALLVTASSGLKFFENYYQTAADKSGILLPVNA